MVIEKITSSTREKDALIAEKVIKSLRYTDDGERAVFDNRLAMVRFKNGISENHLFYENGSPRWEAGDDDRWFTPALPHYTSDNSLAWEIVDMMRQEGFKFILYCTDSVPGDYTAVFSSICKQGTEHIALGEDESVAMAICKAAYKAVTNLDL